ncbi:MAG: prolyl oligopeptidase family serine peptidase [Planctomycetota bacterium]|jgi:prolyl oligopeptidase
MKRPWIHALPILAGILLSPWACAGEPAVRYPATRRVDHVDTYHGTKVADPYRWLEEDVRESEAVAAWVRAQNEVTFAYLASIPERERIRRRLTKVWNYEKRSTPSKHGGRYYFRKNAGLQNQSVLYVQDTLKSTSRMLIDPNTWSKDGTVSLAGTTFSEDGRYMAFGVADGGSDWRTWRVMEIASGKRLADEIRWVKFSRPAWTLDGQGFFYSRFEPPKAGARFQQPNLNQKLYYHRVGTPQSEDVLVYQRPDHPEWGFGSDVTEDGRYLVITIWRGSEERVRVAFKDLAEPYGMPVDLIDRFENDYGFLGNDGPVFYFRTDLDAPRGRVVAVDVRKPGRKHWREILPQGEETLRSVSYVANLFIVRTLKDAVTRVRIYTRDGTFLRDVRFPTLGSARGFGGRQKDTETFYSFSSFATPPSHYRYDVIRGTSELTWRAKVDVRPEDYEVRQVFYHSRDGTRVPMFIAHRKGIALDGSNPAILYGYGGFNISLTPRFSLTGLLWMQMGGVWVMANLRGGGEYGQAWHLAGTKTKKQNVFDDFISAAEWLIAKEYTRPEKLAILGGSNGGLLVGAVTTQRPELFGAALPAVGVLDMLRYHKFTSGRYWTEDYGSSDDPTPPTTT